MSVAWTIVENDPVGADAVARGLHVALRSELPQSDIDAQIVLTIKGVDDAVIAGVVAHTPYGWLHVRMLWVDTPHRGQGLASVLMDRAEAKGREGGCHGAWLDTSNPRAKSFYERRGYAAFGALANGPGQKPATHQRWFMKKMFDGTAS